MLVMKKLAVVVVIAFLAAGGAFLYFRFFRTPFPETVFPENTTGYVYLSDVTLAGKGLERTQLWKAIEESPRKQVYKKELDRAIGVLEGLTGLNVRTLFSHFTREVALGIVSKEKSRVHAVFSAYVDDESEANKLIDEKMEPGIRRRIPDLNKQQVQYSGDTYYKYSSNRYPRATFCYSFQGGRFIAANSEEGMRTVLDVRNGKARALRDSELFRDAKESIAFRHGLFFFVDAQSVLQVAHSAFPSGLSRLWPALVKIGGLESLRSFCYGVTIKNEGFVEEGFLEVGDNPSGLLKIYLDQNPERLDSLRSIPADTKIFRAGTLADFAKMWDDINAQLGSVLTHDEYERWQKLMNAARGFFNFDVRRDLLEPIGNEFAFCYDASERGGSDPSKMRYLVLLRLRKPDQFRETLNRFVSLASFRGMQKSEEMYKSKKLQIVRMNIGQLSVSPAYFLEGSWFYFSSESSFLRKAIDTADQDNNITDVKDYQKVTDDFPDEINSLSYTDVQAYFRMYGSILRKQGSEQGNRWLQEYRLDQEFEDLGKNLFGSASYSKIQEDGIYIYTYSSVPTSIMALPVLLTKLPQFLQ